MRFNIFRLEGKICANIFIFTFHKCLSHMDLLIAILDFIAGLLGADWKKVSKFGRHKRLETASQSNK